MKSLIALSLIVSSFAFANEHAKKEEHKKEEVKTEAAVNPCADLKDKELAACEAKHKVEKKEEKKEAHKK